ncbi:hypothetical protein Q3G72_007753 [Acer saccharum]|nr:hypothetical protein Q3G72_007753 [Acer saccharum]
MDLNQGTLVALEEAKTSVFQWHWKRQNLGFFTSMADEQIGYKQIGKEKRRMMGGVRRWSRSEIDDNF